MSPEEISYYQMSGGDQRRTLRAALKRWRDLNPDKLPVTSLHHGWYGWVLKSKDGTVVARVIEDCIVPYLREEEGEKKSVVYNK